MTMSILKSSTFRIASLIVVLSVILGVAVGRTIAFFTDSKASTGVFTLGNVYISLTEAHVKSDGRGNLVEDTERGRVEGADTTENGAPNVHNYGVVSPGQSIHKDPTITNTGDVKAWVAFKVSLEDGIGDIHKLYGYDEDSDKIDIERLLSGALLEETVHVGTWMGNEFTCYNDNYAMVQVSNRYAGTYDFYFIMLRQLAPGESVEVFDTLTIDAEFNNSEMREFKEFRITVRAYAVQTNGFESCYEAMTTAFPTHFGDIDNDVVAPDPGQTPTPGPNPEPK